MMIQVAWMVNSIAGYLLILRCFLHYLLQWEIVICKEISLKLIWNRHKYIQSNSQLVYITPATFDLLLLIFESSINHMSLTQCNCFLGSDCILPIMLSIVSDVVSRCVLHLLTTWDVFPYLSERTKLHQRCLMTIHLNQCYDYRPLSCWLFLIWL